MSEVDQYIASFPEPARSRLAALRHIVKEEAPDAEESFSYGMPAYKTYKRPLVYFAAFSHHIGLYGTPSVQISFATALSEFKKGKGSVQFPLNQEMPLNLIRRIVQFRVAENHTKYGKKGSKGN